MNKATNSTVASARPHRVPVSSRNRIAVRNKEDGYDYRIVNDVEDRITRFQEGGWEIVPADKAGPIGDKRVDNPTAPGSSSHISVGQGTKAVLMRIKSQYYKEDQAAKQAAIDELEGTMKSAGDYGDIERRKANDKL
jgi:hypothetical protein